MNERIDRKTRDVLLTALENAKAYSLKLQEKREQQLWKNINILCKLSDVINGLSKNEMDKIRKNLELKNLSSLKKDELARELVNLIPIKIKSVLYTLDQERYSPVKRIAKNAGFITNKDISSSKVEALMAYSIIFPGVYNNQKVLIMPLELVDAFLQIDGTELEKAVQRNTEWIRLTHGLLYYYGVLDIVLLVKKIKQFTGQEVDLIEYMNVMSAASDYYGQVRSSSFGY